MIIIPPDLSMVEHENVDDDENIIIRPKFEPLKYPESVEQFCFTPMPTHRMLSQKKTLNIKINLSDTMMTA